MHLQAERWAEGLHLCNQVSDGFSYEKSAIVAWMARSNRSPMTSEPLEKGVMLPNHTLKALIGHLTVQLEGIQQAYDAQAISG